MREPQPEPRAALTALISRLGTQQGDPDDPALAHLFASLRAMAARQLRSQRPGHTLQPTALVNEVFVRVFGQGPAQFVDRHHFFRTAAAAMRSAIIDHERRRRVAKRSVPLESEHALARDEDVLDMLALDECLQRLDTLDPDLVRIAELRVFCHCSMEETAAVLNRPLRSVERDWALARGWLRRELRRT